MFERICVLARLHSIFAAATSIVLFAGAESVSGDVIQAFRDVAGNPNEEFGWDDFGLTGSPYSGPHAPDQFGSGSSISGNSGGLITTTNNLYSFFSVPQWDVDLRGLDTTELYTSVAVQFATSSEYSSGQFSLGGLQPDEFFFVGEGPVVGGFPVNLYWAEWRGLDVEESYSIRLQGTGQHQSLLGVKASYFNSDDNSFDISAVPEPGSLIFGFFGISAVLLRRRRLH